MRRHEYNHTRSPAVDDAIGSGVGGKTANFGEGRSIRDDVIGGKRNDQRVAVALGGKIAPAAMAGSESRRISSSMIPV
jgi:hypothetical protein